jgi:hypothetical protein
MVPAFGQIVEIVDRHSGCSYGADHQRLAHEARVERLDSGFNVDDSFALCTRCGKAVPLKV